MYLSCKKASYFRFQFTQRVVFATFSPTFLSLLPYGYLALRELERNAMLTLSVLFENISAPARAKHASLMGGNPLSYSGGISLNPASPDWYFT